MSDHDGDGRSVVSSKAVDIAVAAIFFAFGALVAFDSDRIGAKWADDGPQSGYFPFYVGLIICAASLVNVVLALRGKVAYGRSFVSIGQLKSVFSVAIPTLGYVLLIQLVGIYVASTVFIAGFMVWLGKYSWFKSALVSVGVSLVFFVMFERWFNVPLPKGPLEALLGLG